MNYSLNAGEWNSVFAVPSGVVDKYLKIASGNSVKLLLFLLRHGGEAFSDDKLKNELGFREAGELEDAALFWVQRGLIRYDNEENGELSASCEQTVPGAETFAKPADIADTVSEKKKILPVSVSSGEIADRIKRDPEIKFLFDEAERLYAHPLKQRENQTVISLTDHYGLSVGVALMLLKYCFKIEKTAPNYISAVADDWASNDINTIELANAKILSLERRNGIEERLRSAMEMTTKLTPQQKEYIRVWTEDWGFGEDMIMLAYDRTVNQIGKWKPGYANKILEGWKNDGIRTAEAVKRSSAARKQTVKTAADQSSSFDMNDVMSKIKNRYNGENQ